MSAQRNSRNGRFLESGETVRERLERSSRVDPETGCRLWINGLDKDGYGKIAIAKKTLVAHRAMWEQVHGPVPSDMCVCHRCDVPACINPDHLWLGPHAANVADRDAKGRQARGETQGLAKLTADDVRAIRAASEGNYVIAKRFNITGANVWFIRTRKTWAHVGDT